MKNIRYEQLSPMNIHFVQYSLEYFLKCCANHELKQVELWGGAPHVSVDYIDKSGVRDLKRLLSKYGIRVSCFTPETCAYPINIASVDKATRERSIEYEIKGLEITRELDVPVMQIVCGTGFFDYPEEEAWKWACSSLFKIGTKAKEYGISLALEPLSPYESNLANTIERTKCMLEQIGLDIFGVNPDTVPLDMNSVPVEECLTMFKEKVFNFHLCDRKGSDNWIPCGDGTVDIKAALNALDGISYKGGIGLEICGASYYEDPDAALGRSLKYIRDMIEGGRE